MSLQERPPVTANSVAKEYFGKELEAHTTLQAPVVVILHDSCYGHRFSRPRATKSMLASIVERPERLHATVLGASAAYVRLGGRHAEGQYPPQPKHKPAYVRDIPFQIRKTSRTIPLEHHPAVTFVHGTKWMHELEWMCNTAHGKLAANGKELARPWGAPKDENGKTPPKLHEGDLYLCPDSLAAFQGCLGGVCDAVDTVFSSPLTKRAFVCIRPPGHHCSSDYPSGFCWLNNVHVGIAYAAMNHGLTHAAIIDFDLHHGDGSQNIAWEQNTKAQNAAKNALPHKKTPIGYYSLHDINSYPCEWGDEEKVQKASLCIENAHGQSIWNVHLEPWKTLEEFWALYETKYSILLEKTRIFLRHHTARLRATGHQPKAAIFISAGFDASEWEGAGMQRHSVNVPTEFYARFTADIAKLAQEPDLGVDGRIVSVLEGGYSDRALTSGVLSHICGLTSDTITPAAESLSGINGNRFQTINNWVDHVNGTSTGYAPEWWTPDNLEELEAAVAGRRPGTKPANDKTGNYSSPTQASTLKMTDHARVRHSLSALQARLSLEADEPPPPDVEWAIAAYELSRVLIPSDRQTVSCTHEELNAEATKTRPQRQSTVGVAAPTEERMQLRDRKAKPPPIANPAVRVASRTANRRTTIAAVSDLPDPTMKQPEMPNGRMRRRSSDASSILSSFQGMKLSDEKMNDVGTVPKSASSQVSSRAPSVVPEQGPKAIAVKKTRAPVTTKGPAKPKTSPRKPKGAVSTLPKPNIPGTSQETKLNNGIKREPSSSSQDGVKSANKSDDVENLTNGMKKISIKLKVPTPEEHAAKQQQKVLDDKQKKPRAPRKAPVTKAIKPTEKVPTTQPASSLDNLIPIQPKPVQAPIQQQSVLPTAASAAPVTTENVVQAEQPSGPNIFSIKQDMDMPPPYPTPQTINPFSNYEVPSAPEPVRTMPTYETHPTAANTPPALLQQMHPPAQADHIEANPLSEAPAPAVATTPVRTKHDLPVFTSSSPIPFAAPATHKETNEPSVKEEEKPANVFYPSV